MPRQSRSRRDMLRTTTSALLGAGALGATSSTSAAASSTNGFALEGDGVTFSTPPSCQGREVAPACPGGGLNQEYVSMMSDAAETVSELAADGHVELSSTERTVMIEPDDSILERFPELDAAALDGVSVRSCGVTKLKEEFVRWIADLQALSLSIYLNDDDTTTAVVMAAAGAAAATIGSAIISVTGIGAVSVPVATAIGAVISFYGAEMGAKNEGCGVKIEEYVGPLVAAPFYDMTAQ